MNRYLEDQLQLRIRSLQHQTETTPLLKILKNINILLDQVGFYTDFYIPELNFIFQLLKHKNLNVIEYSLRILAYLQPNKLLEHRFEILNHGDWIIRSLMYQIILILKPELRKQTLHEIYSKEDHKIRWHIMDFGINNEIKELEKIERIISTMKRVNQKILDIVEKIAFSLWKIKTKRSLDTLLFLYRFYDNNLVFEETEKITKHPIFFTESYLKLCKIFPGECLSLFNQFNETQQLDLLRTFRSKNIYSGEEIKSLLKDHSIPKIVRTFIETNIPKKQNYDMKCVSIDEKIDDFMI